MEVRRPLALEATGSYQMNAPVAERARRGPDFVRQYERGRLWSIWRADEPESNRGCTA